MTSRTGRRWKLALFRTTASGGGAGEGRPAPPGKLGSFCAYAPRSTPLWPRPSRRSRELGLFRMFAPRPQGPVPPGPAGNWVCLYNWPRGGWSAPRQSLYIQSAIRNREIGFVSHNWPPGCAVPQMSHPAQIWLCFASSSLRGLGVPARLLPNWVRFAHFAFRGSGRLAKLGLFCAFCPPQAGGCRPQGRRPAAGLLQSAIRNPQSRNWVCFARLPPVNWVLLYYLL